MQSEVSKEHIGSLITIIKINYSYAYKDAKPEAFAAMIETWHTLLKPYPREIVDAAFRLTLYRCKFPPTIADIKEQIDTMQRACDKSPGELWSELESALTAAVDIIPRTRYTAPVSGGRTQGDAARDELNALWQGLDERIKQFCGSAAQFAGLAQLETLEYERARFDKSLPRIEESIKTRKQMPQELLPILDNMFLKDGKDRDCNKNLRLK